VRILLLIGRWHNLLRFGVGDCQKLEVWSMGLDGDLDLDLDLELDFWGLRSVVGCRGVGC
jgi:hypothetical protein